MHINILQMILVLKKVNGSNTYWCCGFDSFGSINECLSMCVRIYVRVCIYVCIYACVCVCVHVCLCVCFW